MRQDTAFGEFYEANCGQIVALVTALLGDRHEAQDVAQEAFARALARRSRIGDYDLPEAGRRRLEHELAQNGTAVPDAV